jgi:hypothetical protein
MVINLIFKLAEEFRFVEMVKKCEGKFRRGFEDICEENFRKKIS